MGFPGAQKRLVSVYDTSLFFAIKEAVLSPARILEEQAPKSAQNKKEPSFLGKVLPGGHFFVYSGAKGIC